MTGGPDVRIGVVSFDTPEDLEACLSRLPAATEGLRAEVVVVDNGSIGPGDAQVAMRHGVRLVRNAVNVGYARAMNQALAGSAAPVLVALNPDTRPGPDTLSSLVECLTADPTLGLLSPRLLGEDSQLQHSAYAFPSPRLALVTGLLPRSLRRGRLGQHFLLEGHAAPPGRRDVDWTVGAVHCIRRAAVPRERVYSERSFIYGEDMELCWSLQRSGWRVVLDPAVEVVHVGNVTGERAFGASREHRWLDATYDWYVSTHGTAAARRWAAANTIGLLAKAAVLQTTGDPDHRAFVRSLLAFHARRLRRPQGDLHSRLTPGGQPPGDPVVAFDSDRDSVPD